MPQGSPDHVKAYRRMLISLWTCLLIFLLALFAFVSVFVTRYKEVQPAPSYETLSRIERELSDIKSHQVSVINGRDGQDGGEGPAGKNGEDGANAVSTNTYTETVIHDPIPGPQGPRGEDSKQIELAQDKSGTLYYRYSGDREWQSVPVEEM